MVWLARASAPTVTVKPVGMHTSSVDTGAPPLQFPAVAHAPVAGPTQVFVPQAPEARAVPVSVNVTLLVPSVSRIRVSFSIVPVGVPAVGANVSVIVHVPPGWKMGRKLTGIHVLVSVKSGEFVVSTLGNAMGPSPVFVMVMAADCAMLPMATGAAKFTVIAVGD